MLPKEGKGDTTQYARVRAGITKPIFQSDERREGEDTGRVHPSHRLASEGSDKVTK